MKLFFSCIAVVGLACVKLSWAAGPTVWTVINQTDDKVYFQCESPNLTPWAPTYTDVIELLPKSRQNYTWYSFYSGLNPADWHCIVDDEPLWPMKGALRGEKDFKTEFGENLTLAIENRAGTYDISRQ